MATFPARRRQLKKAVASIIGQVDRLHIYLNNYPSIPGFLQQDRVVAHLPGQGDLQELGKFHGAYGEHGYIFLLDDDIMYPKDYVSRMVFEIESHQREAVVGVHGITFSRTDPSVVNNRFVCDFRKSCCGGPVDALGTGTVAFHSQLIQFELLDFPTFGLADVYFASKCWSLSVPLFSTTRNRKWLSGLRTPRKTQLYRLKKRRSDYYDRLLREELATLPARNLGLHVCASR